MFIVISILILVVTALLGRLAGPVPFFSSMCKIHVLQTRGLSDSCRLISGGWCLSPPTKKKYFYVMFGKKNSLSTQSDVTFVQ